MAKTKKETSPELHEVLLYEGKKESSESKTTYFLVIDFVLPPPIYRDQVTTKNELISKITKEVKKIERYKDGFKIISFEDKEYVVPINRCKFYQEE